MTNAIANPMALDEFKEYRDKGFLVIDTRNPQEFAETFVPGAVNIPFEGNFGDNLDTLVLSDRGLILIANDGPAEINALKELGFSNVGGYLEGGMNTWLNGNEPIDMVISIDPHEFSLDFKHDDNIGIYDIRPELGFQQEHLKNAINKSPETLLSELPEFVTNKTYYILCYDGFLSMGVISLIKARGYHNFYHVAGGFQAVKEEEKVELIRAKGQEKSQNGKNGSSE